MAYEVNVSIACQLDNAKWDYLDEPVYIRRFHTLDAARDAYYRRGFINKDEIVTMFRDKFPECKAFEVEASITEDGYEFSETHENVYFYSGRIWTADEWVW